MSYESSKYVELGKGEGNNPVFSSGLAENMERWRMLDGKATRLRNQRIFGYGTKVRPGYRKVKVPTGIKKDGTIGTEAFDHYLNQAGIPAL